MEINKRKRYQPVLYRPGYHAVHQWVYSRLGKAKFCEICGDNSDRTYHWANLSGKYKRDISDWRSLCPPCHSREKHIGKCKKGHEMTEQNTYTYPIGWKTCRMCKKINRISSKMKENS